MYMRLLKFLPLVFLLFPITAFATSAVPWSITNLTDTFIFPNLVNGAQKGVIVTASSTFGAGTQTSGLTVNGGATTTGFINVQGNATSTFFKAVQSPCFTINGSTCLSISGTGTVTQINTTFPILGGPITTTGTLSFGGLSTTSPWTTGQVAFVVNGNTVASVATSSLVAGAGITIANASSAFVIGSQPTFSIGANALTLSMFPTIGAGTVIANGTGVTATPTAVATSSLYGLGTNGFVLAEVNGIPTWTATSTLATITGTLPIAKGGTATTTFYNGGITFFNSTSGTLSQASNPNGLFFNNDSGNLSLGSSTPTTLLTVSKQPTIQTPISGSLAQFVTLDGTPLRITFDTYNNGSTSGTAFMFRRSRGTAASPSADVLDDVLGSLNFRGYGTTGYAAGSTGLMTAKATGAFTDTSMPTALTFDTAPVNSVTAVERVRIDSTGNFGIGTTSPYATLSVNGQGVFNQDVRADFYTATSTTATSTFAAGIQATKFGATATSSFAGIDLNSGCFSIKGVCLSTSGGGVTSIKQTFGAALTGAITLATSSVSFNGLTVADAITDNGSTTFTITPLWSGILNVLGGGTGFSSAADGRLVIGGTTATALTTLATSTGGTVLQTSLTTGRPSWVATSTLGIALSDTTGILASTRGGTGLSTYTTGDILYASNTNVLSALAGGVANNGKALAIVGGIPGWVATTTAGTGLTYTGTAFNVNTTQNITNLSNLSTNGEVYTTGSNGTLNVDVGALDIIRGGTATTTFTHNGGIVFYDSTLGTLSQGNNAGDFFADKANDRIGINDSSPDYRLDIDTTSGNGYIGVASATNLEGDVFNLNAVGNLSIGSSTPFSNYKVLVSSASGQQLVLSDGSSTAVGWGFRNIGGTLNISTTTPATGATSTPAGIQISSSANGSIFGVGTSTPWKHISLVGDGAWSGLDAATSGNVPVCINTATNQLFVGSLTTTCTPSSIRFKNDVNDFSGGLDKLMQLRPVTFYFKQNKEGSADTQQNIGGIAEEVQKVDPRLVQVTDGQVMGVRLDNLDWVLVSAVQEMQKEINNGVVPVKKSMEDNWQWTAMGILLMFIVLQQLQISKLKRK